MNDSSPNPAFEHLTRRRGGRWLQRRIDRKGLRPRYAAYIVVSFWTAAIVVFGIVERLVDPKTFHSIWLGIWWATQTVTTVGYGDIVPQQTAGKAIAVFLMLGGLSLLAVVTGAITSAFITAAEQRRQAEGHDPVMQKLGELSSELEAVKGQLARLGRDA